MARLLNEQLERLRELVRKAYGAVAGKGGVIPEAGDRTMENLPSAIESVPQHGVLTELTVTANGEYLPADYDADGFSKVTANFDTSSLPKVKVYSFSLTDDCINEDGTWNAEHYIDLSVVTNLSNAFRGLTKLQRIELIGSTTKLTSIQSIFNSSRNLKYIDMSNMDVSNVTDFSYAFIAARELEYLNVSGWDTSKAITFRSFLNYNPVKSIDLRSFSAENVTDTTWMLETYVLENIVGNATIEDVVNNNLTVLNKLKVSINLTLTSLDRASLRAVINGLADLTGQTTQILTLGAALMAKLTEEDIAIATSKNWTIS